MRDLAQKGELKNVDPFIVLVSEHYAAIKLGMKLGYDDVTEREFQALLVLDQEVEKWKAKQNDYTRAQNESRADAQAKPFTM